MKECKYIFVTGGVTSSLGKGIIAASLAKLLQVRGFKVTIQKLDPYINVDPGTLNPYEHGECYVTEDGSETDLDLGHYERFLNIQTSRANNVTTGRIYQTVIERERKGEFLGKTVQVVPHITNEIKGYILNLGKTNDYDIIITEIGGTVGDIEALPYIEAVRQLIWELGEDNAIVIHLTLLPYLAATGELKTKPTQHSVKTLMENGVKADILVCRTEHKLTADIRAKLALFCNVKKEAVIEAINLPTIYDVPVFMLQENLDTVVLNRLNIKSYGSPDMSSWNGFLERHKNPKHEVSIALVGKYVELSDSYKSIFEAFIHAGASSETKVNIHAVHSENIDEASVASILGGNDGILVAPGFGERGVDGKICAVKYARENKIPFFGICLGMQMAVIEIMRNVVGLKEANSSEMGVANLEHPVVDIMESQKDVSKKGGTMRLGAWKCSLKEASLAAKAYRTLEISERHRHRYELNNTYKAQLESVGLVATGINPDTKLVEVVEYTPHPWFLGVQYHPEYKSTVDNPHPLFVAFIKAALAYKLKL